LEIRTWKRWETLPTRMERWNKKREEDQTE